MNETFSLNEAKYALQIAALPHEYEKAQKTKAPDTDLKQTIIDAAPPEAKDNLQVIQVSNTTCVMAYNPQDHSVTVSFDPTLTKGDVWDNAWAMPSKKHSLGGDVHRGNYSDLVKDHNNESLPGDNMIDVVGGVLYNYENQQDTPLTVNFTGFSKGGGQAIMAAGELISAGLFDDKENMKLGDVYTFGTLASVDEDYADTFNKRVHELGGHAYTVELQGDRNPKNLTDDAGYSWALPSTFTHVGDYVFIPTDENASPIINPSEEQLDELRDKPASMDHPHNIDSYKNSIDNLNAPTEFIPALPESPVTAPKL